MQIDKQQIIDFIREQYDARKAEQADQELPQQVDPENSQHQNILQQLGIDPQELITRFAGKRFGL